MTSNKQSTPLPGSAGTSDLDAVASAWIAKRDHGFSMQDEQMLAAWLEADDRNREAFDRCESAWRRLPVLRHLPPDELGDLLTPRLQSIGLWPRVSIAGAAVAAAIIAFGLFIWPSHLKPVEGHSRHQYATSADAEGSFILPDNSVAELRRGSEIVFENDSKARRVSLVRGEGHFTVSKGGAEPFIVQAGSIAIRDISTAFDVRLDVDQVAVVVTEGRVEVSRQDLTQSKGIGPEAPILLTEQQQVVMRLLRPTERAKIDDVGAADVERALEWKSPLLTFSRTPLAKAVEEMNRYNRRKLIVADTATGSLPVAGNIRADNLDAFVRLLEDGFGVSAELQSENEIVLRKTK